MKQKLLKSMLLLCVLVGGISSAWAEEAGFTLGSVSSAPLTAGDTKTTTITGSASETWDVEITGTWNSSSLQGSAPNKTWQMGKNGGAITSAIFSTSGITGTITSVVVTCSSYSAKAKVNCTVGGSNFGTQAQATPSWTTVGDVTFSGSASGEIIVTIDNSASGARAAYIRSITVTYSTGGGGGSEPSISLSSNTIEATEAAKEGTINVTYNNLTDYASDVIFVGSDGTTPATYDWLDAEINATDNTKLDYTIDANTGEARTAYMRVYVVDNTLGELYSPVITVTQAAKTVVAPEYNLEGNKRYWQGTEITLTSVGNTIYYNMTTDGTDPATPTSGSTLYSEPIALGNSTAKIWAIAYDTYGNKSSVVKRTYTGVAPATLPFSWDEKSTTTTGIICSTGVGTYNSSPYLKISETGQNVILKFDEVPGTLSFDIKGNTFSGGTFKVQTSADGETYSDLKVYTSLGDKTTESFVLAGTVRYIKWIYTEKSNGNVALGNIKAYKCESIILNASGYATFAANVPLDFSDDSEFSAWQITGVSGNTISFSQITGTVAANTGVLLKGTASATVSIPVAASGATLATNKLTGITTATEVTADQYYGLKDNKFVKVNAGTVPAGKALLPVSAVGAGVKEFTFIFDDKETGIRTIEKVSAEEAAQIFDLSGRRLSKMQKGINIVNGKKILF